MKKQIKILTGGCLILIAIVYVLIASYNRSWSTMDWDWDSLWLMGIVAFFLCGLVIMIYKEDE